MCINTTTRVGHYNTTKTLSPQAHAYGVSHNEVGQLCTDQGCMQTNLVTRP